MSYPSLLELEKQVQEAADYHREDRPAVAGYLDGVAEDIAEARRMVQGGGGE